VSTLPKATPSGVSTEVVTSGSPSTDASTRAGSNSGRGGARRKSQRFAFIDQFRGLVGVMMVLGHANYYFNALWKNFDPLDPYFPNMGQFGLRYMGYLCAPGFLMMNGAMTWYAYQRRRRAGKPDWSSRWHLLQRGLFLILVQITWVNSSWGGFREFKPAHLGIIATIGMSMCLLVFLVNMRWQIRLGVALALFAIHPLLLQIPYDPDNTWATVVMQTFIDAGKFNKYPVIPWFALAVMGSVMAEFWIDIWKTTRARIWGSLLIGVVAFALATWVRLSRGYGNIFIFDELGHISFFLDQKYPPSLYHNLWFFGAVVTAMAVIVFIGRWAPRLVAPLGIVGKVPLFFYCVHIAILGVFAKRIGIYYREGAVLESVIGWLIMLAIMFPLAIWFGRVKQRSRNYLVRLI
jgi:uncharacterized membrane protein